MLKKLLTYFLSPGGGTLKVPHGGPNLISFCLISSPKKTFFDLSLLPEFRYFRPLEFLIVTDVDGGGWSLKSSLILLTFLSDQAPIIHICHQFAFCEVKSLSGKNQILILKILENFQIFYGLSALFLQVQILS